MTSTATPPSPPAMTPWDAHAVLYEQVFERSTWLWARDALTLAGLPLTANGAGAGGGYGSQWLDVACGSGKLALKAATLGFNVLATDLSQGMLDRLAAKIQVKTAAGSGRVLRGSLETRVVDGQTLAGLADESFDVVSSVFGVFLFPDRMAAWTAARRVLRPTGHLVTVSWDAQSHNITMIQYVQRFAEDRDPGPSSAEMKLFTPDINRTLAADTFREELLEAGFVDVRVITTEHAMCFRSGEELVRAILDNGGLREALQTKRPESVQLCILDYCEAVRQGRDPFGPDDGATSTKRPADRAPSAHALWATPIAISARGHIAIARKTPV